jgi:signal transduction histidine kinase
MLRTSAARSIVSVATGVVVTIVVAFHFGAPFDVAIRDPALRLLPGKAPQYTAVVAIDEGSLQREGAWPWPRSRLAALVDGAADAGATAIGVDILLPDSRPGDEVLATALRRAPSVAAAALDEKARWILPAPSLRDAVSAAHASFELDHDGVLRRVVATKQSDALVLAALPVHLASGATRRPVPTGRTLAPAFRVPPRSIPVISAADVLHRDPRTLRQLRGRIVLIGLTAFALGDRVVTPRSLHSADPGVLVHAAATESFIAGDVLRDVPPWAAGVFAALLVWSALSLARFPALFRIPASGALVVVPVAGAFALALINVAIPAVTIAAASAVVVLTNEALRIVAFTRHGRAAAAAMQANLGIRGGAVGDAEIGPRLEELATAIARRRAEEVESKRVLAHELKTPLAAMRSLSQVLAGFDLSDDERHRVASLLGSEAGKLQDMVGGLLELERLALRDFDATTSQLDLGEMLNARLELLRRSTSRTIECELANGSCVRADSALLDHVIDNLVTNAIKYSPDPDPVFVSLRCEGDVALLEVADRGRGIPVAERQRIFRRFMRGGAAEGIEGLGLGLALVAEVVQWHGGTVVALDRPGGGSIFRVSLPLAVVARREAV